MQGSQPDTPPHRPAAAVVPPLVEGRRLCKSYAARVLDEVDFDVRRGEVHALVGENGAGKSTLARIISGLTMAESGEMRLGGRPYRPTGKADAQRQGVRMVLQELNVIGTLTVAESLFLDRMPHRFGWIDYDRMNRETAAILQRLGLGQVRPDRLVATLGIGQQQLVEIAAGLSQHCDVLILDEPTAALTDPEIELLFAQIRQVQAAGAGVIYISHRLEEIQRIADRISVLRDGQMVVTRPAREVTVDEVVRWMVGRPLHQVVERHAGRGGEVALRVEGLCRGPSVRDVSFEVRRGEILGFAGLMGSGRTETMRAIFGADRPEGGRVFVGGSAEPVRIRSPKDAVRLGIALLTEDRKEQGLLLPLAARVNITLMALPGLSRLGGWIQAKEERGRAEQWAQRLALRCSSVEQRVDQLSGGNQQKVVLAKWLLRNCEILIFDEPTRGIDVGAKFEIYGLLSELAARGKAVVVVSSDLLELLALSDRIAVMSAGRLVAAFERGRWSQDAIMAAALSGYLAT